MKILQINTVYKTGSTGKIAKDLNDLMLEDQNESFVAHGRGYHRDPNIIKISSKFDFYIHALNTRLFDKHGLSSKRKTKAFINKIKDIKPNIIHLHNIHGYYLNYPVLFNFLKEYNRPVIWTLHDCWAFTGHCAHYDYIKCSKWQNECYECPQLKLYPRSILFDNSKKNFQIKKEFFTSLKNLTIVTPSNWLKNEVEKSFLNKYKIKTIHNGIDINIFQPLKSDFRNKYNLENKFLILGVANVWESRKGLEDFIKLSSILSNNEKIILIGVTNEQKKILPKNIIGIKRTENQKQLAEIYSTVNVFVNATFEEVLGLTNIEALACGTPVITYNSGGSPETIDEKTGICVPKGELEQLYEAILKILNNTDPVIFSSNECRKRAEENFDKNIRFKEYIKLYNNLMENEE